MVEQAKGLMHECTNCNFLGLRISKMSNLSLKDIIYPIIAVIHGNIKLVALMEGLTYLHLQG